MVCIIGPAGVEIHGVALHQPPGSPDFPGTVVVDGHDIMDPRTDINAVRTEAGMVFQQFNLFPHMSVRPT